MAVLQLKDRVLYWRTDGDPRKTPLVLLNSLGTDHSLWDLLMPELLRDFWVLRMDKRGHGGSTNVSDECSIADLAQDVLAVMDVAQWPRAHICGISIGAMTAMWLGVHAPDRVNRLVLSNTSAKGHSEVYAQRMVQVRDHGLSSICDGTMGRFFMPTFVQQANPYFLGLREVFLQGDPRGYIACCAALRDMDLREVLPTIRAKSLVIIGEFDQGTTPDMGELIARSIPGASSVVMPYAHIPILEDPEGYLALVRNFLLKT